MIHYGLKGTVIALAEHGDRDLSTSVDARMHVCLCAQPLSCGSAGSCVVSYSPSVVFAKTQIYAFISKKCDPACQM